MSFILDLLDLVPRDDKITCFSYNGKEYSNNTKCPNSDSCCQTAAQCRDDRLCTTNGNNKTYLRATCANNPYTLQTCAQVCTYDNSNGVLPRVNICADGSYCCDNNPTCCADKAGLFLNSDGVVIGRANQTTISSSSSMSSTSLTSSTSEATSSTPATTSASPTTTATQTADPAGLSVGAKAGIGIGVALGACALLLVGAFFLVRRRRARKEKAHSETELLASNPMYEMPTTHDGKQPGVHGETESDRQVLAVPGMHEASPDTRPVELPADPAQGYAPAPAYEDNEATLAQKPTERYK